MAVIKLELDSKQRGAFKLYEESSAAAEMDISISDGLLTVYHTEVLPEFEGKGFAKTLLLEMARYARQHQLMVLPLCPFVHGYFKTHREEYKDIWKKSLGASIDH